MRFVVFSVLLAGTLARECGTSAPTGHQHTEGIAPLGKWPWQVYVRTPGFCGGTIISDRWILTAAHFFWYRFKEGTFDRNPIVRTGVVNVEEASKDDFQHKNVYEVKTIHMHKEYNTSSPGGIDENDIALLELDRAITYSDTVAPICLTHADQDLNTHHEAWIIGFGHFVDDKTNKLVRHTSNVLRESKISLAGHKKCKKQYKEIKDTFDFDRIICAGSYGIGAGQGDSGGPLMLQSVDGPWYQAAVVSFGKDDSIIAADHTVGAYTSVSDYCDWIALITNGEAKCAEKVVEMKLLKEEEREETEEEEENSGDEDDGVNKKDEGGAGNDDVQELEYAQGYAHIEL